MDITIRRATLADMDRLMEIEHTVFPDTESAPPEVFAYRMEHFGEWFNVAVAEGCIAGILCARLSDVFTFEDCLYEPEGESAGECLSILSIETAPEFQRKGVAAALIGHAEELARRAGARAMTLACKDHLIKYYQGFGFEKQGISKSVHGGVLWYDMKKTL